MLPAATLDAIAGEVRMLRDQVRQTEPLTSRHPGFGIDEGYAVAARLHAFRVPIVLQSRAC